MSYTAGTKSIHLDGDVHQAMCEIAKEEDRKLRQQVNRALREWIADWNKERADS